MIPTYGGVLSAIKKALQEVPSGLGGGPGEEYSPIGEDWGHDGAEIGIGRRERERGGRR